MMFRKKFLIACYLSGLFIIGMDLDLVQVWLEKQERNLFIGEGLKK
jgi:hypothetical protein